MTIALSYGYTRLAKHYGIIDIPNERSSHQQVTIRGIGLIIPIVVLIYSISQNNIPYLFTLSIVLGGLTGFIDDIKDIHKFVRLALYSLCIIMLIGSFDGVFTNTSSWLLLILFAAGITLVNIYNFMDGINGLTLSYSISFLVSVLALTSTDIIPPLMNLTIITIICLTTLLFYNFRVRAIAFLGDSGSISIGLLITFIIYFLIITQNNYIPIAFVSLYIVDGLSTILYRFINGEKISTPHRSHLYQKLVNEKGHNHLYVSIAYCLIQLAINFTLIFIFEHYNTIILLLSVYLLLFIAYSIIRRLILRTI